MRCLRRDTGKAAGADKVLKLLYRRKSRDGPPSRQKTDCVSRGGVLQSVRIKSLPESVIVISAAFSAEFQGNQKVGEFFGAVRIMGHIMCIM